MIGGQSEESFKGEETSGLSDSLIKKDIFTVTFKTRAAKNTSERQKKRRLVRTVEGNMKWGIRGRGNSGLKTSTELFEMVGGNRLLGWYLCYLTLQCVCVCVKMKALDWEDGGDTHLTGTVPAVLGLHPQLLVPIHQAVGAAGPLTVTALQLGQPRLCVVQLRERAQWV